MVERSREPPSALSWSPTLAAGVVPLVLYVMTASGTDYWLDSAEFTAAALELDIPHPPGHPLASLWGKLFTLLPVGPAPFRVAVGQAAAMALALACLQRAFARSSAFMGLAPGAASLVGLGGAWLLAASHGAWFQSVRAEVYALQTWLVCLSLERLSVLATRRERDVRPFLQATLALGLGLANHHFMAVLALPALLWAFVRLSRAHGLRPFGWGLLSAALGLSVYAYLPLRARTLPAMNLGHPTTLDSLAWVVSARVYAKRIGSEAVQPLGERFADLAVILVDNLGWPTLTLMLLGAYTLARRPETWELGFVWIVTASVSLLGRAWLNPVRANPDVLGYMLPGFAAVIALAACGFTALAQSWKRLPRSTTALSCLAVAAGAVSLGLGYTHGSLARFEAPDRFDEVRIRRLPRDACVVLVAPQSVFRHFGADAVEQLRPDVLMVALPFLDYGDSGEQLARKHEELSDLVHGYLREQALLASALDGLSMRRRVFLELDTARTLPLISRLLPNGLYYEWLPEPPPHEVRVQAAARREALYTRLYAELGSAAREQETLRQLLWLHYTDALYYAAHGMRAQAATAVQRGLTLAPHTPELLALSRALLQGEGALDIRPFLVAS